MSTTQLESEVLRLLNALDAKKTAIHEEYTRRLAEVDRELEAVNTTARLLNFSAPQPGPRAAHAPSIAVNPSPIDGALVSELVGMTARQALIFLAKRNGNRVVISEAKPLIVAANIMKDSKNTWGAIYTTLTRSKEFEKIVGETGAFRLIDQQGQLLPESE